MLARPRLSLSKTASARSVHSPSHSPSPLHSLSSLHRLTGYGGLGPGQPCLKCEKNQYKSAIASTPCTACPDKSTTASLGSTKLADCVCLKGYARVNDKCEACPTGTYADTRDQPTCTKCPAGSTTKRLDQDLRIWETIDSATNVSDCVCKEGYMKVPTNSGHICVSCPIGEYSTEENAKTCTPCPSRTTTRQNTSTSWEACLCIQGYSGRVTSRGSKCSRCRPGFFKDSLGWAKCNWCEENTATKSPHFTSDKCLCNPGYVLDDSSSAKKCRACPANTYKNIHADTRICSPCPALTSTDGAVAVESATACTCDPGYYANSTGDCTGCPVDTFKDHSGNGECQLCREVREHSSSKNKTQLTSVKGCLCDIGFFLFKSQSCRACAETIEHCLECETHPSSTDAAICTKAPVGYSISDAADSVFPNKCTGPFKFGNDVLPEEMSISHCLEDAIVDAVTGSLCQPLCETDYKTAKPLPTWKTYSTGYCETDDQQKIKIEYKDGMSQATCRKYCELLSDCYFFVEYEIGFNKSSCAIWRANRRCNRLDGFRSGDEDEKNLVQKWHAYEGISDDGFQFICDKDGVWNAQKLEDKESAVEFFQRQCEMLPTTAVTTTSTTPVPFVAIVEKTTLPPPADYTMIIAIAAGGGGFLILLFVIILIVVLRRTNVEHSEKTVISEEEINEIFQKTDDDDGYTKSWMDGDKPATFDVNDDVPT